jgi:hypothetical protein
VDFRSSAQDKPYDFVPLTRPEPRNVVGHDRLRADLLSGRLTGELTARSPVHVASGSLELTGREHPSLVKAHFRTEGKVASPGSTLKGVVRSIVEAVSHSCVRVQSKEVRRKRVPPACNADPKARRGNGLCPACRLFGAPGYAGRVSFSDAPLVEGRVEYLFVPSLFSPRYTARVYYRNGELAGRKFYLHGRPSRGNVPLEACAQGSKFRLVVNFDNLSPSELGLLLVGLGQGKPGFVLKLGGAKPACLGSVEVSVGRIEVWDVRSYSLDFEPQSKELSPESLIDEAMPLLIRGNLERLQKILAWDKGRSCPSGPY